MYTRSSAERNPTQRNATQRSAVQRTMASPSIMPATELGIYITNLHQNPPDCPTLPFPCHTTPPLMHLPVHLLMLSSLSGPLPGHQHFAFPPVRLPACTPARPHARSPTPRTLAPVAVPLLQAMRGSTIFTEWSINYRIDEPMFNADFARTMQRVLQVGRLLQ